MNYRSRGSESSIASCGCGLLLVLFNLFVGGWSVNYLLQFFLAKTIPFIGAMLIGLIVGEISVPVAIVVALLKTFGIL
jgi:uncharacterized membrane protein YcjF (UPF0283 family)